MGRHGEVSGRRGGHRSLKQLSGGLRALAGQLSVAIAFLLILTIYLFYSSIGRNLTLSQSKIKVEDLWGTAPSGGWKPLSDPRSDWLPPPIESNGYLRVRCNGGLNQQRSAKELEAEDIMEAVLKLPKYCLTKLDKLHNNTHMAVQPSSICRKFLSRKKRRARLSEPCQH